MSRGAGLKPKLGPGGAGLKHKLCQGWKKKCVQGGAGSNRKLCLGGVQLKSQIVSKGICAKVHNVSRGFWDRKVQEAETQIVS